MNDFKRRVFEYAKRYAEKGWAVLPVHTIIEGRCTCGKADCSSAGKHPATPRGVKDATTDADQIQQWFANGRVLNIGIAAGAASGLAVLDIDPKDNGDESIKQYSVPDTLEVINSRREWTPLLTEKEVKRYYTEDKIIWSAFLNLRRFDRWISTRLLRRRYEFILPGKIRR